jgi:hypothetical protein
VARKTELPIKKHKNKKPKAKKIRHKNFNTNKQKGQRLDI